MSTEQRLQAIIEAQVRGGHNRWRIAKDEMRSILAGAVATEGKAGWPHILEILLDPAGLRAAYGTDGKSSKHWERVGISILKAWLSSDGEAEATISTAYDLLP